MARGSTSKTQIFNKLLETFPLSFMVSEKELRIPMTEDGVPLEIKVTLTAAKDILGKNENTTMLDFSDDGAAPVSAPPEATPPAYPTEEEKENVAKLLASLGL